jgi:Domain of unknown function (DUF1824)
MTDSIDQASKILAAFSCVQTKPVNSELEKASLIKALELFTSLSDAQNFGICAEDSNQGFAALVSYLHRLGYEVPFNLKEIPIIEEPVYIKFSTKRANYHVSPYTEKYRGVLISCQSEECGGTHTEGNRINGTYGYLPLDLFSAN